MLRHLELKIPPVVIWLGLAGPMYFFGEESYSPAIPKAVRVPLAIAISSLGFVVAAAAVSRFRKNGTTINPHHPDRSLRLVTSGIYQYTRNPMYLGLLLCLEAWALYLFNPYAFAISLLFIPIMNRLQIWPEERFLKEKFGKTYEAYCRHVRRWI